MKPATVPVSSYRDHPLWIALSGYSIGPDAASLSFAARLARENGWSAAHAKRVLDEYRRFLFLAATSGHAVTPSDAVDQAWHLHLTYSEDYWNRLCGAVLRRPLHHGPTQGGEGELHRFHRQYAETLASYERIFGESAPIDLWPPAAQRLREDPKARRVHPRDAWIVPKRPALLGAAGVILMLATYLVLS